MSTPRPEEDKNKDPVEVIKDDLHDAMNDLTIVDDITDDQMSDLRQSVGGSSDQPVQSNLSQTQDPLATPVASDDPQAPQPVQKSDDSDDVSSPREG